MKFKEQNNSTFGFFQELLQRYCTSHPPPPRQIKPEIPRLTTSYEYIKSYNKLEEKDLS